MEPRRPTWLNFNHISSQMPWWDPANLTLDLGLSKEGSWPGSQQSSPGISGRIGRILTWILGEAPRSVVAILFTGWDADQLQAGLPLVYDHLFTNHHATT